MARVNGELEVEQVQGLWKLNAGASTGPYVPGGVPRYLDSSRSGSWWP